MNPRDKRLTFRYDATLIDAFGSLDDCIWLLKNRELKDDAVAMAGEIKSMERTIVRLRRDRSRLLKRFIKRINERGKRGRNER